jgi:hypothetical protein
VRVRGLLDGDGAVLGCETAPRHVSDHHKTHASTYAHAFSTKKERNKA